MVNIENNSVLAGCYHQANSAAAANINNALSSQFSCMLLNGVGYPNVCVISPRKVFLIACPFSLHEKRQKSSVLSCPEHIPFSNILRRYSSPIIRLGIFKQADSYLPNS